MAPTNGEIATQVRIHLKARDADIELPQETGAILVSTDLKRYQLSTLVNRLLESERPVPLEFLINGQFLRTSIDEFLSQNGISPETTINVEYVKALVPPLHVASYEHDDWVSSVDVLSKPHSRILSASFDGALRVWNMSSEVVATGQWHTSAAKSARWISPTQIASCGDDRSVRVWTFEDSVDGGKGKLTPKLELRGHKLPVDRLAVHAPSSRILSASSDHRVGLWSTKASEGPPAPARPAASNKRRKISGPPISTAERGALAMLEGHQENVKDVTFDRKDPTVAYSCSMDQSVKTWDLTTSTCVDTKSTDQALLALAHLSEHSLIATGGIYNKIDLVDIRASATKVTALTCRGHRNWVRSISRDPGSAYQFVSAGSDSTCKIWDIRSTSQNAGGGSICKPVYTIERESVKGEKQEQGSESVVYGVYWDTEVGIVSGGMDMKVQINKST